MRGESASERGCAAAGAEAAVAAGLQRRVQGRWLACRPSMLLPLLPPLSVATRRRVLAQGAVVIVSRPRNCLLRRAGDSLLAVALTGDRTEAPTALCSRGQSVAQHSRVWHTSPAPFEDIRAPSCLSSVHRDRLTRRHLNAGLRLQAPSARLPGATRCSQSRTIAIAAPRLVRGAGRARGSAGALHRHRTALPRRPQCSMRGPGANARAPRIAHSAVLDEARRGTCRIEFASSPSHPFCRPCSPGSGRGRRRRRRRSWRRCRRRASTRRRPAAAP